MLGSANRAPAEDATTSLVGFDGSSWAKTASAHKTSAAIERNPTTARPTQEVVGVWPAWNAGQSGVADYFRPASDSNSAFVSNSA